MNRDSSNSVGLDPESAALKIQAIARGRQARQRPSYIEHQTLKARREEAAVKIQAVQRGQKARHRKQLTVEQNVAAMKIQEVHRRRLQMRKALAKKLGGYILKRADIRGGLSLLGRNPFTLTHCYIRLSLPDHDITDIKAIKEFRFLQHVHMPNNRIKDPMPLAALPFLITLNLKGNELLETPNFDSYPGAKDPLPWNTYPYIGSMLHEVNLSFNKITKIGDFSSHRFIHTLHLDNNQIKEIRGLDQCKQLQVLTLSHNCISVLRGLDALPLTRLDLSYNQLAHIHNLNKLPNLQQLSLAGNSIELLSGLRQCTALCFLDLTKNQIKAVRQVEFLQGMSLLHTLLLEDNPVEELPFFRLRVLVRLQKLTLLNRMGVSPEEKVKAINFHGGPESDVKNRETTFKKFFPHEKFTNTVEPFVEPEPEPEVDETPEYIDPELAKSLTFNVQQYLTQSVTKHFLSHTLGKQIIGM
mmetsp:Transcript_33967/g.44826  ORF Transcript_33967/g.44826 Transcript_33967/m.44826 type:complete len:470 (+) Transcript_33967:2-1411(+)